MDVLVDGRTGFGTHIRVLEGEGSYLERFEVYVNGEQVPYSNAFRLRDGGSTRITTEPGELFAYRRLGQPHWSTWNEELLRENEDGHL